MEAWKANNGREVMRRLAASPAEFHNALAGVTHFESLAIERAPRDLVEADGLPMRPTMSRLCGRVPRCRSSAIPAAGRRQRDGQQGRAAPQPERHLDSGNIPSRRTTRRKVICCCQCIPITAPPMKGAPPGSSSRSAMTSACWRKNPCGKAKSMPPSPLPGSICKGATRSA